MGSKSNIYSINPKKDAEELAAAQKVLDAQILEQATQLVEYFVDNKAKDLTLLEEERFLQLTSAVFQVAAKLVDIMIRTGPINGQTH